LNDKDTVGIIIKDSSNSNGPYYCNLDNIRLAIQNKETGEYICPKCGESYFPNLEKVKKGNKFETPSGPTQPILSLVNDNINTEASSVYNQPKIPRSFESILKRPGVKLLDYTTSED
jgi:predicted RNA-binding Zn-ribbon protein involved in translation (DUF1610 family)